MQLLTIRVNRALTLALFWMRTADNGLSTFLSDAWSARRRAWKIQLNHRLRDYKGKFPYRICRVDLFFSKHLLLSVQCINTCFDLQITFVSFAHHRGCDFLFCSTGISFLCIEVHTIHCNGMWYGKANRSKTSCRVDRVKLITIKQVA